jgi:predicted DNA-binding ribbon-helix-helix protein
MRLEPVFCDMLDEICEREGLRSDDVTRSIVAAGNRTSAVRVFIANYFRVAATDAGHSSAGHGDFRVKPPSG